eukprot:9503870-Pyramimonas_sp.AAC.4
MLSSTVASPSAAHQEEASRSEAALSAYHAALSVEYRLRDGGDEVTVDCINDFDASRRILAACNNTTVDERSAMPQPSNSGRSSSTTRRRTLLRGTEEGGGADDDGGVPVAADGAVHIEEEETHSTYQVPSHMPDPRPLAARFEVVEKVRRDDAERMSVVTSNVKIMQSLL